MINRPAITTRCQYFIFENTRTFRARMLYEIENLPIPYLAAIFACWVSRNEKLASDPPMNRMKCNQGML